MNNIPYYQHSVTKISFGQEIKVNEDLVDRIAKILIDGLNLTVVNSSKHEFTNGGLTKFWVLSQSHLVIHSWPEMGFVHVDLMTCSQGLMTKEIIEKILMPVGAVEIEVVKLEY